MCQNKMEFQYCCFLGCCFFVMLLYWIYDSLSSENIILHIKTEMDFQILQESEINQFQTLKQNKFISNIENITILIGLSPIRSGSSYIHSLLQYSFDLLHYNSIESNPIELHYWDRCIIPYHNYFENDINSNDNNCNFNDYLSKFIHFDNITNDKLDTNNYKYILFENTHSYIRYYHSCYLLSHYSKLYNIKFYLSLRNPTDRTWYEYWMHFNFKYNNSNNIHINKMIDTIDDEIDTFPHSYPKYQKLLDYIKINNSSYAFNNKDINEEKVIDLWIDA
eukprot:117524_1